MSSGNRYGPWVPPRGDDVPDGVRDAMVGISRGLWLVVLLVLLAAAMLLAPAVQCQDRAAGPATPARLSPQVALLAFEVARVAMNESMGADLALIWQVVEGRARGAPGRRRWLRSHSRCVAGMLPEAAVQRRPGPCRWTRELRPNGRRPPSWRGDGWPRMRVRWLTTLRRSLRHARGELLPIVCPSTPASWDGPAWGAAAARRGWVALDCKGTLNVGYVR